MQQPEKAKRRDFDPHASSDGSPDEDIKEQAVKRKQPSASVGNVRNNQGRGAHIGIAHASPSAPKIMRNMVLGAMSVLVSDEVDNIRGEAHTIGMSNGLGKTKSIHGDTADDSIADDKHS